MSPYFFGNQILILDLFGNLDREEKKKYTIHEVKGRWTTKKE
jgi:hypothetical protein